MRRVLIIIYAFLLLSASILFARESIDAASYILSEKRPQNILLASCGLLVATVGPLAISITTFMITNRFRYQWILHLSFIFFAVLTFTAGASLFYYGANVSNGNLLGDYSLILAGAYVLATIIVHAIALVIQCFKMVMSRPNSD